MPIANVIRIMRRILPPHAKISDDAKETIQECVSEFISFVTSEANERCHQEQRKTITADDVLWAMGKLGFDNYTQPLSLFLQRYREAERESNSVRGESLPKRGLDYGAAAAVSLPPILPAFNVSGNIQTMMYDPAQVVMGGYYRDESGGSSSQQNVNNIHGFDNFPQGVPGNKIDDQSFCVSFSHSNEMKELRRMRIGLDKLVAAIFPNITIENPWMKKFNGSIINTDI
ncbi:nuclear transcription factor Y subunit B-9-like [Tripterygium wilfordii]|uniref:nuclear transcription factor Y subunit B-9-like n=1 Tax=Tripterygium wilfordii TaxID=458696 RepID=UPI0018F81CFF|nr:nuclear transcription factor Y subunit B-9-like [Tripterygium wilfordii]